MKEYINLSHSFPFRTKCKYCFSGPSYLIFSYMPKDTNDFNKDINRKIKRREYTSVFNVLPINIYFRDFAPIWQLQHEVHYKSFNTSWYIHKDTHRIVLGFDCECGRSFWQAPNLGIDKPERVNRLTNKAGPIFVKK